MIQCLIFNLCMSVVYIATSGSKLPVNANETASIYHNDVGSSLSGANLRRARRTVSHESDAFRAKETLLADCIPGPSS